MVKEKQSVKAAITVTARKPVPVLNMEQVMNNYRFFYSFFLLTLTLTVAVLDLIFELEHIAYIYIL